MAKLTFSPPTQEDMADLVRNMRMADWLEVIAARGPDVAETVREAVSLSVDPLAVHDGPNVLAIVGTVPIDLLGGTGVPWLLGTSLLAHHPRTLSRVARRYIDAMLEEYALLVNFVDARNTAAIRLLRWLGFTLHEPEPFGVQGLPFHRFELRRV